VWRYTREITLLRIEAQKQVEVAQRQVEEIQQQTELQIRPFVMVEPIFAENTSHGNFVARNVGNGTGLNIRVWFVRAKYSLRERCGENISKDDLFYEEISFPDNESIWFRNPPVYSSLTPHQTSDSIDFSSLKKTEGGASVLNILHAGDVDSVFMIRAHFENVHGQKYFVEETVRRRTLKILRHGRLKYATDADLIRIAEDEEPYLTDEGRREAQNWIQPGYTYLP
jgi:hypothetical protein